MNTSSIIILFSIRKIYYILRRKSSIFMSRFFYFGGYIIRGGGGYRIFSVPKRKQLPPPAREGFCCEARFRAEQQKGRVGEAHFLSPLLGIPGQNRRKRNKPLQSDDFSSLRYLLEKNFWSGIKHVWKKVSGLYGAKSDFRNFISWNFISKSRISFLKTDRGAGFEVSPGFPISYPVQFGEEGKYLIFRAHYDIIKENEKYGEKITKRKK